MFDLSWSELLLVGAIALVVIGPRELPRVLRTIGQSLANIRRMAGEFRSQFSAAMREAELDEIRSAVNDVRDTARQAGGKAGSMLDPLREVRNELREALEKNANPASDAASSVVDRFDAATPAPGVKSPASVPDIASPAISAPEIFLPEARSATLSPVRRSKRARVIVAAPREAVKPLARPSAGRARLYKMTKFSAYPARPEKRKSSPGAPEAPAPAVDGEGGQ
ncbi:MAG: Sec-independent protein translocase protein TatB [Pseudochelatococcus sp.]|jgi:sec-independent protein translocase protein TatB|uniref:Sec-independent protein translocase protein TatB n=1 Tax=Pseudochelatococcus sp. TaxID=2020869 RepID=UPI003D946A90